MELSNQPPRPMPLNLPNTGTRQREVLDLICQGKCNKQIATALGISIRTVEIHRSNALHRLGARSGYQAIVLIHTAEVAALKAQIADLVKFIADELPALRPGGAS